MTENEFNNPIADLNAAVAVLVEKHGSGRTLIATLKAYFWGPPRPPDAGHLSNHLMRDMGLPERDANIGLIGLDARF